MASIEPDSPQAETRCYCGEIHRLGDTDCGEMFVGWIEDDCTYESERERDLIRTEGAFFDAFRLWNRSGGVLGRRPDAREIAERLCRNPANIDEAAEHAEEAVDPSSWLVQAIHAFAAQRAHLN